MPFRRHRAESLRISACELGAQKQNLSGIVNPHQNNDQRTRRPISIANTRFAEIKTQQNLSRYKQQRRPNGPSGDIAPAQSNPRQHFEHERE